MTANHIIIGLLLVGIVLLIIGWRMDSKSSFEDGSFLIQMLALVAGGVMIIVGLGCKLIMSLAS